MLAFGGLRFRQIKSAIFTDCAFFFKMNQAAQPSLSVVVPKIFGFADQRFFGSRTQTLLAISANAVFGAL